MTRNTKDRKMHFNKMNRPIFSLLMGLGFLSVILLITMLTATGGNRNSRGINAQNPEKDNQESREETTSELPVLAIVKAIDYDNKLITLHDVEAQRIVELSYTGGTDIRDKYDKIIAMSQMKTGMMVDALYQEEQNKLLKMNISSKAWEYIGVSNFTIDQGAKMMKIASSKYRFTNDVLVLNDLEEVSLSTLTEQDELTVRGYEEIIYSIIVTRGHGTVVLEDYDTLLGSEITIGYEAVQQITEDMELNVREGEFNLTVDTGDYSATKRVTVLRNEVNRVSLSDLAPETIRIGKVIFKITPFGADLYIDGDLFSYAEPIELPYGDHSIKVTNGGYTAYQGTLTIDSAGKTVKIDLPKSQSSEQATVEETEGTSTDTTDDTSNGTTDSENESGTEDGSEDFDFDSEHLIYVQEPIGASVYIDGVYQCTAPGSFKKIIGTHVITFIRDGYVTKSYTVEISDDGVDAYFTFPALQAE
ncbi:MAG: PEGA domain-containing protein [Mobilitalea sp.]